MSTTKTTPVERKRRRVQISRRDVREVAKLVAKRLTEAEACECLGIRPRTWYGWREIHRNQAEYAGLLTRVRGQYIRANLREMEKASVGQGGHRPDWRAADRLNAIVAPDRYAAPQPPPAELPATVPPATVNVWIDLAYAKPAPGQVVDVQSSKQLVESTEPPAAFPETQPASPVEVWMKLPSADPAPAPPARDGRTPPLIADKTPGSTEGG
jgi:hypothetical protein